jgi:hypothetical protein
MRICLRRREFIARLSAVVWPLAARVAARAAQQATSTVPMVSWPDCAAR